MSNTPEENAKIEEAKADYMAYTEAFEKKYGYQVAFEVAPSITKEGYIKLSNSITLIKIESSEEQATTPQNADTTTEETSTGDSQERAQA